MKKNHKFLFLLSIPIIISPITMFIGNNSNNIKNNINQIELTNNDTSKRSKTLEKTITINEVMTNANTTMPLLQSLNNYFAQELITIQTNQSLIDLSEQFNNELISLINMNPSLFFDDVVSSDQNPNNLPFVQDDTKLDVIVNHDIAENNGVIKVTLNYLMSNDGSLNYQQRSFNIDGFNVHATAQNHLSISIQGYQYNDNNQVIIPSEMSVDEFRFGSGYDIKKILADFINKNINYIFINTFSLTVCGEINNNIDNDNNNLIIRFKITNYAENGGNLVFASTETEYTLTIEGFKDLTPNPNVTSFKDDLNVENIVNFFSQPEYKSQFPTLASLSSYFIEEFSPNVGYKYQDFINELRLAINLYPSFWFNNPVNNKMNPYELPIVKNNINLSISIDSENQTINIYGYFLCQPEYLEQVVNQNKDYKKLEFKISNSQNLKFGSNALNQGTTSFKNYFQPNNVITSQSINIDNYADSKIANLNIQKIEEYLQNNINELINMMKEFVNINNNRLFNNILKDTIVDDDGSVSIRWINNELSYSFKLLNYYNQGVLINNISSNYYTITLSGFKDKDFTTERNIIIIVSTILGAIIIALIIIIIVNVLKDKNKPNIPSDKMYIHWKE